MKLTFLLSLALSLPAGFNWGSMKGSIGKLGTYAKSFTPESSEHLTPAMSSEELDAILKNAGQTARAVKNPQIIIHQTGTDATGKAIYASTIKNVKIKQSARMQKALAEEKARLEVPDRHLWPSAHITPQGFKTQPIRKFAEKTFKPGMAQVVGLDGKKGEMVRLDRLAGEGLGIKRIQRLYGLATPK